MSVKLNLKSEIGGLSVSVRVGGRQPFETVRTGSWTGPPRGERAPRVGISSTVFGVRGETPSNEGPAKLPPLRGRAESVQRYLAHKKPPPPRSLQ